MVQIKQIMMTLDWKEAGMLGGWGAGRLWGYGLGGWRVGGQEPGGWGLGAVGWEAGGWGAGGSGLGGAGKLGGGWGVGGLVSEGLDEWGARTPHLG